MHLVALWLSLFLALTCAASAVLSFQRHPDLMAVYERLGWPEGVERPLGVLKVVLALGLLLGRGSGPVAFLSAWLLTLYLFGIVIAYRRTGGPGGYLMAALGGVALVLAVLVSL